ncbi:MAG TPA: efflux RND transporter periplasmic adaptor subunit, partial [Gemmatimonadaceae bacterium]|nr:efflux RND transporter periplasmic adaptor subunit [Gemmatimonadaceae bacterium]
MASKRRVLTAIGALIIVGGVTTYFLTRTPGTIVLTGIVTTNDVIVSPQLAGQIDSLLVQSGDTVARGQRIAVLSSAELNADRAFYERSEQGAAAQVTESEASLRFNEQQTAEQIRQADATLGATVAQRDEAAANLADAKRTLDRDEELLKSGGVSPQVVDQARTAYAVAKSHADAVEKQVDAARAALAVVQSNAQEVAAKRGALQMAQRQQAAAAAQTTKASVRLGYAELRAPTNGIVDVDAARQGEVVSPGQPVVTIVNPDDFWVRADVE